MGNSLRLGLSSSGNSLGLFGTVPSNGTAQGQATAQGVPVFSGLSAGTSVVTAQSQWLATAIGLSHSDALVIAQGLSNRGNGLSLGVATVFANNARVIGQASGAATVSGVGLSHSEFAPYFLWPGYSCDGTHIVIPLDDLDPILDASEADTVTGDWRKILQSVFLAANDYYQTLVVEDGSGPQTYRSFVSTNYNMFHPDFGRTLKRKMLVRFNVDYETGNVADEP